MTAALMLVLIGGLFVVFVLAVIRYWPTAPSRTSADRFVAGTRSRDDERCWFGGGLFYDNPDDPALLVPNRYFFGLTLNVGHPLAKLLVVLVVGLLLAPVALAIAFDLPSTGCHTFGCLPR